MGGKAATSSQNSITGGCGCGESILTTGGTEGIPRSDLTCGGGSCKFLLGGANFHWLPARASEQGNVIGLVSVYSISSNSFRPRSVAALE